MPVLTKSSCHASTVRQPCARPPPRGVPEGGLGGPPPVPPDAGPPLELRPVARAGARLRELREQAVRVADVALVEGPVLLDLVVRDALEAVGLELLLHEIGHRVSPFPRERSGGT